ncbi:hypothetical protein DHB64_17860 [Antarcticibacterium sp. W02-3]|nr:hypothetical protein [Antarcticibacterium sp. W02-3]
MQPLEKRTTYKSSPERAKSISEGCSPSKKEPHTNQALKGRNTSARGAAPRSSNPLLSSPERAASISEGCSPSEKESNPYQALKGRNTSARGAAPRKKNHIQIKP